MYFCQIWTGVSGSCGVFSLVQNSFILFLVFFFLAPGFNHLRGCTKNGSLQGGPDAQTNPRVAPGCEERKKVVKPVTANQFTLLNFCL